MKKFSKVGGGKRGTTHRTPAGFVARASRLEGKVKRAGIKPVRKQKKK